MLRHKNIDRICCAILALTMVVSALFVGAASTGRIAAADAVDYEDRLFDQSRIHTIDIVMDDWDAFLDTCASETYSACHLVIDGESVKNAAIRGKGNTSLSSVAAYGNNRYSFKIEFDHYQTGNSYYGLDKLSLNNLIQDNTYMKDYFAYTLMNEMGVAAPLCSFARINVNGEYWGLYLAVEGVEEGFLQRNYGKDYGELYKPDSLSFGGGRGNGRDFDMEEMAEKFGFFSGTKEEEDSASAGPQGRSGGKDSSEQTEFDPAQMLSGFGASFGKDDAASAAPGAEAAPSDAFPGMPSGSEGAPVEFDFSQMPEGFGSFPEMPDGGSFPSGMTPPSGFDPSQMFPGGNVVAGGEAPQQTPDAATTATQDPSSFGQMPGFGEMPDGFDPSQMINGDFEMPDMDFGGFGGFGSSTDVKLQYIDDDPASYENIFNNAKTDITKADQARLIASIKALNENDTSVVDVEAVIRYMAVHNFLCNDDSYTGMMVHNYYLYEDNGVLSMIPWDYNLAYGGFSAGSNATSTVNADVDRLVSMGSDSDRPMAGWITSSEAYIAQYRAVYQEWMTTVFDSGWFEAEIDRVTAMIAPYVESDPTAFCTYEEFQTAAQTLKSFCLKRAESVSNQLAGDDTRVDASDLDLSVMGTMDGMGGGFGKPGGGFGGFGPSEDEAATFSLPSGSNMPAMPFGDFPDAFNAPQEVSSADDIEGAEDTALVSENEHSAKPSGFDRQFGANGMAAKQNAAENGIWIAVCAALLLAGIAFVKWYPTNR